jgi:hypothetical protein
VTPCCGNCRFVFAWKEPGTVAVAGVHDGMNRTCRRFPPTALMTMQLAKLTPTNPQGVVPSPTGMFPPTAKEAWCGEYQPKAGAVES